MYIAIYEKRLVDQSDDELEELDSKVYALQNRENVIEALILYLDITSAIYEDLLPEEYNKLDETPVCRRDIIISEGLNVKTGSTLLSLVRSSSRKTR